MKVNAKQKQQLIIGGVLAAAVGLYMYSRSKSAEVLNWQLVYGGLIASQWPDLVAAKATAALSALPADQAAKAWHYLMDWHFKGIGGNSPDFPWFNQLVNSPAAAAWWPQ